MILPLQGLRALGMLCILFFHAGLIPNGIFPVTLFFILSGFVLYYKNVSKISEEVSLKESISWGIKKTKRMYFVHFVTFLMSIILRWKWVTSLTIGHLVVASLLNLSLLQATTPTYSLGFNSASWYLSTTFMCYLFVPILIKWLRKKKHHKTIIISIYLTQIVLAVILPHFNIDYNYIFYMCPLIRILDLLMGMTIGKMFIENQNCIIKYPTLIEIGAILLFMAGYILSFILPVQFAKGIVYTPGILVGMYYVAFCKGKVAKLLCAPILQVLAKYSFEFYMLHGVVIIIFKSLFSTLQVHYFLKCILIAVPTFIVSWFLSILLHRIKEINKTSNIQQKVIVH